MDIEQTKFFKKHVNEMIDTAVKFNGGIEHLKQAHKLMPSIVDFVAGWVARDYWIWLQVSTKETQLNQEELRRIYDLVRLRLDTESSTS